MSGYTPMIEQYLQIKNQYQDAILFFRLGDFYEMFFEDAIKASRELEIVLTSRDGGQEKVPMCGVPYHAVENYLAKLVSKGHKVAICEQVEDPREARGVVKREVIRIVTPGSILEDIMLDEKRNNYLAAVIESHICALAWADISTGEFRVAEFSGKEGWPKLLSELQRLAPAECLVPEWSSLTPSGGDDQNWLDDITITIDHEPISTDNARRLLLQHFGVNSLEGFGLKDYSSGIQAAAVIIRFLQDKCKTRIDHLRSISTYSKGDYLEMDFSTRRNLELTVSLRENRREGSLLAILDGCLSAPGKRTLRRWIEQPLLDLEEIRLRQDGVEEILTDIELRERLKKLLASVNDLERIAARIGAEMASPRDLVAMKNTIQTVQNMADLLTESHSSILQYISALDRLDDIYDLLERAIMDDASINIREGNIIKTGYHEEIDELRRYSQQGSQWLLEFENREKQRTGIKYLKVGFNRVFGYYIEISKSNLNMVPDNYHRKQTLANTERFICEELKEYEEKALGARDRLFALEYQEFVKLRNELIKDLTRIQDSAHRIAVLDVLYALADRAYMYNYNRPVLNNSRGIVIKNGRHPVVEQSLSDAGFVPNDICMDTEERQFAIITGPNMGGKSTFMRQVALLVIMAQMGSFVPAESVQMGIVDQIFTRVGAADDLSAGQSTFMVEMMEVANILHNAGRKSLIILDEIGRGTSTYDGLSIAQAVAEYIHDKIKAKTLFATHYHELTSLAQSHTGIYNLTVSVRESGERVVFLKKVLPGKADKSYGLHVAALAGVPDEVVKRGQDILQELEKNQPPKGVPALIQPMLFGHDDNIILELRELDADKLSPREALNLIYRWKESL